MPKNPIRETQQARQMLCAPGTGSAPVKLSSINENRLHARISRSYVEKKRTQASASCQDFEG